MGVLLLFSDRLHNVSVIILDVLKTSKPKVSFPGRSIFWNPLPKECFPVTYDLNCLKV